MGAPPLPPCQSQRCQEELIYGRRTADVSTYHECHRRSVLERSLLQARQPGTDCLQPFDILTVSLVSSVKAITLTSDWKFFYEDETHGTPVVAAAAANVNFTFYGG